MPKLLTDREILEMLKSGASADEFETLLGPLTAEDRQAVLCTACFLVSQVEANCRERAQEIVDFIEANCKIHCSGRKLCGEAPVRL